VGRVPEANSGDVGRGGPVERIVAERNGTIIGSVLLYPPLAKAYAEAIASAGWPEVRLLAVAPVARGQRVGTALMDECEQRARRVGATMLGLHTMDMMQAAVHMYEHRGFERAPELDFSNAFAFCLLSRHAVVPFS